MSIPRLIHRNLVAAAVLLVAAAAPLGAPGAQAADALVRVHSQSFDPQEVQIDPGGTVTWLVEQDDHTIVADDGRFAFRGPAGGALQAGDTRSYTFGAKEEVVTYFCEIHRYMVGSIRVGDPQPPPPPPVPVVRVPTDQPTLAAALAVAGDGSRIELEPGTHAIGSTPVVSHDDLTIVGVGSAPTDVVLAPSGAGTGVRITGSHVRVSNLTLAGFPTSAIEAVGADAIRVDAVVVDGGGLTETGIDLAGVTGATVDGVSVTAARGPAVKVSACPSCGARVRGSTLAGSGVGLLLDGARGVEVHDNAIAGNGAGIVARALRAPGGLRSSTLTARANELHDNQASSGHPAATGAGIWLHGVADTVVEGNRLSGHSYGIVLAGDAATSTRVLANVVDGNRHADLGWDGLGAQVCFAGNQRPFTPARTHPDRLETLYPCDRPTVGVPYPLVLVNLHS